MRNQVIDRHIFEQLGSELASPDAARRIAALYLDLLDGRIGRLVGACEAHDEAAAMDAALSLKVSSAMVGAVAMRDLAAQVEVCLLGGGCDSALGAVEHVRRGGFNTARALANLVEPRLR